MSARRARYAVAALGTIAIGLLVHFRGAVLGPVGQDVLGDALWAVMMACWIGALASRSPLVARGVASYAVCAAVELSQLWHTPALDQLRATRLGHLVLGSGFDPRDLLAYATGVLAATLIEWRFAGRR